ncbi:MAG: thiamine pyrophosphate-dependent enzyme [Methanoregula sp.]|jgi:2-oxoglutarate ferredoxin oxidoreductase subunit beta|uniref:thiamine pyrophosphate-dependent enzyme n=1 Tax=Methanoregula sp. TaxID=2052170 RepID=UPI003D0C130B
MTRNLITPAQNTWCPGCGNFALQHTLKEILAGMEKEGRSLDDVVLVTGIGCHAKIADYLNINSVYTLHGRTIPVATGIKLANPKLTVICCAGDGDAYAEGLDHLIFAAKRNIDITMIVHNNRVYGLTTGQYTPTSPLGFKGKSTPAGTTEYPFNPLELMLASGATYIARGYTRKMPQLAQLIRQGIVHKGFAFIDVLQICASFFNMTEYYQSRVYDLAGHDAADFERACAKAREWDYNRDAPIALGAFYERALPTFDDRYPIRVVSPEERTRRIRDLFEASG